jgi:hypothetical protein
VRLRCAAILSALVLGLCREAGADDAAAVLNHLRELTQTTRKWTDRVQELKLRIVDRRGGERTREMLIRTKKYDADRTRTLVRFESPGDVKGVAMLQWADPKGTDEQWLFLPELRKVRRIAGGAKRESFVGTDFSYEDLAIISQFQDWSESEARATLLRQESIDGQMAEVIEFVPTGKELAYSKLVVWLRSSDLVALRFELYESAGEIKKRLVQSDWRPLGAIPTAFHMEMENIQGGSKTVADFSKVTYDSGLADDVFTQRSLE